MNYKQCTLRRGTVQQVAWIPSKFAVVGKFLRVRDENGWQVTEVGGELDEKYVLAHRDDYREGLDSIRGDA